MAYCIISDVRLKSGISSTADVSDADITSFITLSDSEINNTTNQNFGDANSALEYHNVYQPKRADDILPNRILLKHYPVQSIATFTLLDSSGTASTTLAALSAANILAGTYMTADYYCDVTNGLVELTSKAFDFVPRKAKITYTYGFASVPAIVKELSASLSGIRAWIEFLGGNYNRLNSYSVPEQSYQKGDFYARGRQIIDDLTKKSEELFNQLMKKQRSQIMVTSGGYF